MKTAIAYRRIAVDSLRSPRKSIHYQGLAIEQYCKETGITLLQSFEDIGSGSTFEKRSGWKALEAFIQEHPEKIRYLLVTDASRIGRNAFATIDKLKELETKYGTTVLTTKYLNDLSATTNDSLQTKNQVV